MQAISAMPALFHHSAPQKESEYLLSNCPSNNSVFQGEIGLPGPPGHDGEKVRHHALPFKGFTWGHLCH